MLDVVDGRFPKGMIGLMFLTDEVLNERLPVVDFEQNKLLRNLKVKTELNLVGHS